MRRYVLLRQSEGWRHKSLYHLPTLSDGQLVPVRGACTLIHAHNSETTCLRLKIHKKLSSLHGLSSLSFCRWGPVTPCIYTENIFINLTHSTLSTPKTVGKQRQAGPHHQRWIAHLVFRRCVRCDVLCNHLWPVFLTVTIPRVNTTWNREYDG